MSSNFHEPWVADGTLFKYAMTILWKTLDDAITYLKNVIIHCDGNITYSCITGKLTWDDEIRLLFTNDQGDMTQNIITPSSIVLSDNNVVYVDLSYTNDDELTVEKSNIAFYSTSPGTGDTRLVLGYRDTASDRFFSNCFKINPDKLVQEI